MRVQESSQVGWVSRDMVAEGLGRLDGINLPEQEEGLVLGISLVES